jgi:hypothetical protein
LAASRKLFVKLSMGIHNILAAIEQWVFLTALVMGKGGK